MRPIDRSVKGEAFGSFSPLGAEAPLDHFDFEAPPAPRFELPESSEGLALGSFLGDGEIRDAFKAGELGVIVGTDAADELEGTAEADLIFARGGDDRIDPGAGSNLVRGGDGEDTLVLSGDFGAFSYDYADGAVLIQDAGSQTSAEGIELVENADGELTPIRFTLQLLHASDLEGNAGAVENAPNFAAIVDELEDDFANTLLVSSGDNFIPSPFSNAAGSEDPEIAALLDATLNEVYTGFFPGTFTDLESEAGRFDISIMNILGFDASALGNHEFDFGQQQLEDIVAEGDGWAGAFFPYLSANLVVEPESTLQDIYSPGILQPGDDRTGVIAPAAIVEEGGERIGIVGATTQLLETISSTFGDPDNPDDDVAVAGPEVEDMAQLAAVLQPVIDEMREEGVNKIVLTSHLQQIALEQELAGLLDGVDIIIAGGSDTLLADGTDALRDGDTAAADYPLLTTDAAGNPTLIVSADGQYSYVGRLVVDFDPAGNLILSSLDPAISGAYATDGAGVLAVTGDATLDEAIATSDKASAVKQLVDAIETTVLEVSGTNFLGEQDVFINGERGDVRQQETNLGNLTADANLWVSNELAAEPVHVSLKNAGGIRDSIPGEGSDAGDGLVSELEIQTALSFNNALTLVTLTPEQLLEVLNHGLAATTFDANGEPVDTQGRFPQVAGIEFSYDPDAPAGSRIEDVVVKDVDVGGVVQDVTIVEDGAVTAEAGIAFPGGIRTVTLDFLVGGGDGYPYPGFGDIDAEPLVEADIIADGAAQFTNVGTEQDALAEYLAEFFPVDGDPANDFDMPDTPIELDERIVNLALTDLADPVSTLSETDSLLFA